MRPMCLPVQGCRLVKGSRLWGQKEIPASIRDVLILRCRLSNVDGEASTLESMRH